MTTAHCTTCGSSVNVVTNDDGTSYYEPLDPHRERLVSALRIADDALSAATRQNSDTWETTTAVATKALAIVRAALDPNAEARCAMSGCLLATPHHHVDTPDGEYVIRDPKPETPKEEQDAGS